MDTQKKEKLFQAGLDAFNSERFYDAHEHWEEVWLQTANPEKMFLQGLIQVAAAFHHHSKANPAGTRNLLQAGITKLDHFPPEHYGLELEPLRESVRGWLAALDARSDANQNELPRIKCCMEK